VLFVGVSDIVTPNFVYKNTDIYACRIDGTSMVQLTYHAADDLSPVWSCDGKYIYFVSQRGSATATANIWRMPFVY
jgi:Tol biopolymer transport system component